MFASLLSKCRTSVSLIPDTTQLRDFMYNWGPVFDLHKYPFDIFFLRLHWFYSSELCNITFVKRTVTKTGQLKSCPQYYSLMFPLCGVTQKWKEMAHLYHTSCSKRDKYSSTNVSFWDMAEETQLLRPLLLKKGLSNRQNKYSSMCLYVHTSYFL